MNDNCPIEKEHLNQEFELPPADTRTGLDVFLDAYSDTVDFQQDLGNYLFADLPDAAELRIVLNAYQRRLNTFGSKSHISMRVTTELLGEMLIKCLEKAGKEIKERQS